MSTHINTHVYTYTHIYMSIHTHKYVYIHTQKYICLQKVSKVSPSCPTLCDPMDCSPPGSSVRGVFQATTLEWGAISFSRIYVYTHKYTCVYTHMNTYVYTHTHTYSFSRGSSRPRDRAQVSSTADRCFTI